MNVPPCGWKTTGWPSAAGPVGDGVDDRDERLPAGICEDRRARLVRPTRWRVAIGGSVDRQAQDLALPVVQEAQPLLGDGQRVGSWAVDGRRDRDVDLGEAQPPLAEGFPECGALGKAVAELGALVPDPRDLIEDRQRIGAVARGTIGVAPEHGRGPDRRPWQRVVGAAERLAAGARRDAVTVLIRALPRPCFGPARARVRTGRGSLRDALTTGSTPLLARAA